MNYKKSRVKLATEIIDAEISLKAVFCDRTRRLQHGSVVYQYVHPLLSCTPDKCRVKHHALDANSCEKNSSPILTLYSVFNSHFYHIIILPT